MATQMMHYRNFYISLEFMMYGEWSEFHPVKNKWSYDCFDINKAIVFHSY